MSKLTVYRGISGCGKSSEAQKLLNESSGTLAVIERDLIRDNVFGSRTLTGAQEATVTKVSHNMTEAFLNSGLDVIISDTNMRDKYVREFAKIAAKCDADFEQKIFDLPVEECIARDAQRTGKYHVGEDVIRRQAKSGYPAKVVDVSDIIFDVEPYVQPTGFFVRRVAIFDIDGTCASMITSGRSPYAWHQVDTDDPKEDVLSVARNLYSAGCRIVFLSGRDSVCRELTENWLDIHFGEHDYELYMRKEKDNRPDSIVKYELFNAHIRPRNEKIVGVFDDRDQVVKIWRRMGMTCFQVDYGNF